jgi:MFS family permease
MPNIKSKFSFRHLYYGWYILTASFIILFFNAGAQTTFSILFKPMIAEFGWSRGTLSFAFLINMIVYSITLIVFGKLYDKYGPKWLLITATVLVSSGYILCNSISSIWQFYIYYGFFAAVGMGGTSVPLFAAIMSKWFNKRRGLIISLGLSGTCLGRFVLIPAFSFLEQNYGWRASYLIIGIIMFLVNMVLIIFVIRNSPDNYAEQLQDNVTEQQPDNAVASGNTAGDLRLTEAMRTGSFWLFTLAMFICGSGDFLLSNHLVPFATDLGFSAATAANMLAWNGLLALAGILIAGHAADIIGNKIPIAVTFLLRVLSFILILFDQSLLSSYIFALVFGFTLLVTAPLSTTLAGRIYGYSNIGLITGFINTVHFLGGGLWTYIGGLIYDRTGNYNMAFVFSAVMAFVALVSTLLIIEKKVAPGKNVKFSS